MSLNSDSLSLSEPTVEHEGTGFFLKAPRAEKADITSMGASSLGEEGCSPLGQHDGY